MTLEISGGSSIFLGAPTPKVGVLTYFLAKKCMKMKEFGTPRRARVPGSPLRSATGNIDMYCVVDINRIIDNVIVVVP